MKNGSNAAQVRDQARLLGAFAALNDPSLWREWIRRGLNRPQGRLEGRRSEHTRLELLGEGAHFRAWGVPARGQRTGALEVVIKVATGSNFRPGMPGRQAWLAAIRQLNGCPLPLIPPFYTFEEGEDLAIAMPWGKGLAAAASPHWQPLGEPLQAMQRQLQSLGLMIADVPQIRTWEGIPFLVDLSDLTLLR